MKYLKLFESFQDDLNAKGEPFTYNTNNGQLAWYDGQGRYNIFNCEKNGMSYEEAMKKLFGKDELKYKEANVVVISPDHPEYNSLSRKLSI